MNLRKTFKEQLLIIKTFLSIYIYDRLYNYTELQPTLLTQNILKETIATFVANTFKMYSKISPTTQYFNWHTRLSNKRLQLLKTEQPCFYF